MVLAARAFGSRRSAWAAVRKHGGPPGGCQNRGQGASLSLVAQLTMIALAQMSHAVLTAEDAADSTWLMPMPGSFFACRMRTLVSMTMYAPCNSAGGGVWACRESVPQ